MLIDHASVPEFAVVRHVGDELKTVGFIQWQVQHPLIGTASALPLPGDPLNNDNIEAFQKADKLASVGKICFWVGTGATVVGGLWLLVATIEGDVSGIVGASVLLIGGPVTTTVGIGLMLDGGLRAAIALRKMDVEVDTWPGWAAVGLYGGGLALSGVGLATGFTGFNTVSSLMSATALVLTFVQVQMSHNAGYAYTRESANHRDLRILPKIGQRGDVTTVGLAGSW